MTSMTFDGNAGGFVAGVTTAAVVATGTIEAEVFALAVSAAAVVAPDARKVVVVAGLDDEPEHDAIIANAAATATTRNIARICTAANLTARLRQEQSRCRLLVNAR